MRELFSCTLGYPSIVFVHNKERPQRFHDFRAGRQDSSGCPVFDGTLIGIEPVVWVIVIGVDMELIDCLKKSYTCYGDPQGIWLYEKGQCDSPDSWILRETNKMKQLVPIFAGFHDTRLIFPHIDSCAAMVVMMEDGDLYGFHMLNDTLSQTPLIKSAYMACDGISYLNHQRSDKSKPRVLLMFGDRNWEAPGTGASNRLKVLCRAPNLTYHFQQKTWQNVMKHGADLVVNKSIGVKRMEVREYPYDLCSKINTNRSAWQSIGQVHSY